MTCEFSQLLSAYSDDELDDAARAKVHAHLEHCPECAKELAELTSLSRLFAQSSPPRLSQIALHRLHDRADMMMCAKVLRVARVLQAIAACVLVSASLWLMHLPSNSVTAAAPETVESAPPMLDVAVRTSQETQSLDATTPAAAWYLADVSSRSPDMP